MVIGQLKSTAGKDKSLLRNVLSQLRTHLDLTSSLTGLTCPELPGLHTIDEIKAFTSLIDSTTDHPWRMWWESIADESRRFSFAHSLFLFRKVLPGGDPQEAVKAFVSKMGEPAARSDPDFIRFVQREIPKIFRKGWDRNYHQVARNLCLSTSSCLECPKSKGGPRGSNAPLLRSAFQRAVGAEPFPDGPPICKVTPVRDGGKWRVVTVGSGVCEALKPWHHLMYDHLSRFDWLCRGSPKVDGFAQKRGEIFVSGDYESATDAIPTKVYLAMLGSVCGQSDSIPMSVKEFAFRESRKVFVDDNLHTLGHQKRGQLMGSYLSFPFLCLLNYLCFKYSIRRKVPLLINGDDIVFRCTTEEKDRWMLNVRKSGLILSRGKTLVHERIFTLNSTLFRGTSTTGKPIGFFRPKAFFQCPSSGVSASGQFNSLVVGYPGARAKDRIQVAFLRRYASFLHKRQLPLRAALGFRVSNRVLRMSGFFDHERFYLGLGVVKMPNVKTGIIPGDYSRQPLPPKGAARRDARASESLFFQELLELTWLPYKRKVEEEPFGVFRYHAPLKPKFGRTYGRLSAKASPAYLGDMGKGYRRVGTLYWRNDRGKPRRIRFVKGETVGGPLEKGPRVSDEGVLAQA